MAENKKQALVKVSDLWRSDGVMSRSAYVLWGSSLCTVKYAADMAISGLVFHRTWSLFNYFVPGAKLDALLLTPADQVFFLTMVAFSLPFIWIGCVMTMRRLRAADLPPWLVMLFFVPVANLMLFSALCTLPTRDEKLLLETEQDALPGTHDSVPELPGGQPPASSQPPSGTPQLPSTSQPGTTATPTGSPTSGGTGPSFKLPQMIQGPGGITTLQSTGSLDVRELLFSSVVTVPVASFLIWIGTAILQSYGWGLFIGVPFAVGAAAAYLYGRKMPRSMITCMCAAWLATFFLGVAIILYAWEGVICLMMAAPIGFALATMGALLGYAMQKRKHNMLQIAQTLSALILVVPLVMGAESKLIEEPPLLAVQTIEEIDAPRTEVWKHVVAFPKLAPPKEFLFHAGVAYPIGATINGSGVGAVRKCNFSTGTFIEPITTWQEPELLQFGVLAMPEPMKEFTYREIEPAHLHGYLNIHKGEFRLEELPGNRTRLVGTTWYDNRMWPSTYWRAWADHIIHLIHNRVLTHIKDISETKS